MADSILWSDQLPVIYTCIVQRLFFFHTADRTGKNSYIDDIFSGSPVSNRM